MTSFGGWGLRGFAWVCGCGGCVCVVYCCGLACCVAGQCIYALIPMFFVLENISRDKISIGDEKNMSSITLKVNVFKEGDVYVALCPLLDVSSFGDDIEHAKNSLKEALEAFLEECEAMGTLEEVLEETGFIKKKTTWVSEEPIMEAQIAISC